MGRGLLETVALAGSVLLAAPVALFGADRLQAGDPAGVVYLGLAVGLILIGQVIPGPEDVLGDRVRGTLARLAPWRED